MWRLRERFLSRNTLYMKAFQLEANHPLSVICVWWGVLFQVNKFELVHAVGGDHVVGGSVLANATISSSQLGTRLGTDRQTRLKTLPFRKPSMWAVIIVNGLKYRDCSVFWKNLEWMTWYPVTNLAVISNSNSENSCPKILWFMWQNWPTLCKLWSITVNKLMHMHTSQGTLSEDNLFNKFPECPALN